MVCVKSTRRAIDHASESRAARNRPIFRLQMQVVGQFESTGQPWVAVVARALIDGLKFGNRPVFGLPTMRELPNGWLEPKGRARDLYE